MAIFEGAGVALITPFCTDESVDYDQLEKVIDYQISIVMYYIYIHTVSLILCGSLMNSFIFL